MFHTFKNQKKQDKICSISDFSSTSNFTERQITAKVKDLVKQSKRKIQNLYQKPVFIISSNLKSKHITSLTQLFEQQNVPLQFQHQTNSLGLELNTTFFVVGDNKNEPLNLGKQFTSPLMTVIGFPKIGSNKKNIYCQYPEQVFQQYKKFVDFKPKQSSNLEEKISQLQVQESMFQSGFNASSILGSEVSGIKLKSISKYDKKNRQNSLAKASSRKTLLKNGKNKENQTSIQQIHHQITQNHNLYLVKSNQDDKYNNFIQGIHNQLKNLNTTTQQQSIFCYPSENELIQKLNQIFSQNNEKLQTSKKQNKYSLKNKCHFIILSSDLALKMATRIQSEFYLFKDKIRFIVVMLTKQNQVNSQILDKEMLVVKKAIQSNLFQFVVTSSQECEKALKSIGFNLKYENPFATNKQISSKNVNTKSKKTLQWSGHNKSIESSQKQDDQISFCPSPQLKNVNSNFSYVQNTPEKVQKMFKNQSKQHVSFKRLQKFSNQEQDSPNQNCLKSIEADIAPIISVISPVKSSISSTASKRKIIKVIKKQPSNLIPSSEQNKSRNISDVNSQYCINKNKFIVQKLQQKMIYSKRSLSSNKNIKSLQKDNPLNNLNRNNSKLSSEYSSSKIKSIKFITPKYKKSIEKSGISSAESQYGVAKSPQKKNIKKIKMNLTNQPFISQCSQVFDSDIQSSKIIQTKERTKRQQSACIPFSSNNYYVGSSILQKSNQQHQYENSNSYKIDGLLYVEYNQNISTITREFTKNCPSNIINKQNIKPFYLACEYSRQLRKIWKNGKHRNILPVIVDTQGLSQIHKYYTNVMYEDDELQFYSSIKDQSQEMENTGKFTVVQNQTQNRPHLLLFFTIVSGGQINHSIFNNFERISARLPKYEVIKYVVQQNLSDKQMKDKSIQIYNKMFDYFKDLGEQQGDRFVQTI